MDNVYVVIELTKVEYEVVREITDLYELKGELDWMPKREREIIRNVYNKIKNAEKYSKKSY